MHLLASESSHIFVDENICPTDAFGNFNPARSAILRYKIASHAVVFRGVVLPSYEARYKTASHRYDAIDT